ncbi:MAG: DEDD exonuclease domain-containing protein [Acidimicrobiales bacterium]
MTLAVARSFDDLGTPLCDVTFVVLDLETTGGSPASCEITEIGAVKIRGGETLGTFQTLVNPGLPIPPSITFLTGITEAMVMPAPRVDEVLTAFCAFVGGAVIVGHNVRFDLGFLGAAMERHGHPRFNNVVVDTCALARRLVRDEVPNCKLHTLAAHFRVGHRPTHRALDDALATAEVLHALLERAGSLGVLGLEDLVALPTVGQHPQLGKLTLTARLPKAPGVYIFRDTGGRPLYVGKALDLRRRVRSYFTGDERRKVGPLLRELVSIDHIQCTSELEASVLEVRLIHRLAPRYNTRSTHWRSYAYVKLTLDERWPRLSVVREPRSGDGCLYLGPVGSARTARMIVDALHTALPIRRCTRRIPVGVAGATGLRDGPCAPAQLGVATCPCAGAVSPAAYAAIVGELARAWVGDHGPLLHPLAARLTRLAGEQRYEEAADLRDRAAALARALERQGRHDALRLAGRLHLRVPGGGWAIVEGGVLHRAGSDREGPEPLPLWEDGPAPTPPSQPLARELVDEVATIAAWIDARAAAVTVVDCEGGLAWPVQRLRSFEARQPSGSRRGR